VRRARQVANVILYTRQVTRKIAGQFAPDPFVEVTCQRTINSILPALRSSGRGTRAWLGLGAAAAFLPGTYGWSNVGALLLVLSNFLDHTDGELARMSGKTSRFGHLYDLASDAVVTILLFVAIGIGVGARPGIALEVPPLLIGAIAGSAVALIFFLRMRIEEIGGKAATRLSSVAGFETEDVLYLMPLATLSNALEPLLLTAAVCAPLYFIWTVIEYRRVVRRPQPVSAEPTSGVAR
jgi:phosphatidylglycerophosphate synthase